MDYPSRVTRLVIIDAVPIIEALERCDARVAERRFDWFFFAQPETPERVISADPLAWYRPDPYQMGAENYAELVEAINDPETVRAMLEDYRAALSVDRDADRADRLAGRTIGCPTLVVVGGRRRHGGALWRSACHLEGDGPRTFASFPSTLALTSPRRTLAPWRRRSPIFWPIPCEREARHRSGGPLPIWGRAVEVGRQRACTPLDGNVSSMTSESAQM